MIAGIPPFYKPGSRPKSEKALSTSPSPHVPQFDIKEEQASLITGFASHIHEPIMDS